jgi:hypothetical protein
MGHNLPKVDRFGVKVKRSRQTVFVIADIKHKPFYNDIHRVPKVGFKLHKVSKTALMNYPIPVFKGVVTIRMFCFEIVDRDSGNDSHTSIIFHLEIFHKPYYFILKYYFTLPGSKKPRRLNRGFLLGEA